MIELYVSGGEEKRRFLERKKVGILKDAREGGLRGHAVYGLRGEALENSAQPSTLSFDSLCL